MVIFRKTLLHLLAMCVFPAAIFFYAIVCGECVQAAEASLPEKAELYFTILHTNDEHSALIPHAPAVDYLPGEENPTIGGYARLGTALQELRAKKGAEGEPVLLLSAGDFIGGTAFSWLALRGMASELSIKHELAYDVVALGNHEFDYGTAVLADYLQAAGYPAAHSQTVILASNAQGPADHPLVQRGLYRETHLLKLDNGLKVGFFSLLGSDALAVAPYTEPLEFSDPFETAQRLVTELRAQGASLVVALTHAGDRKDRALAQKVPGIDLIVGGHTHTPLETPLRKAGTIIVRADPYLASLGVLELAFHPETGELRIRNEKSGQPFLVPLDHRVPADPEVAALVEYYTDELNRLVSQMTGGRYGSILETIAWSADPIQKAPVKEESPLGNFVADAMRLVAWEETGKRVDLAFQADGNIRGNVYPGSMGHTFGNVSFYALTSAISLGAGTDGLPGHPLVYFYLTGEELIRLMEFSKLLSELAGSDLFLHFSGIRYAYNPQNVFLFTIPFLNVRLPSARAVHRAELYTGEGVQGLGDQDYVPLHRGDESLYSVVTDAYVLSYFPLVSEMFPRLALHPKDEEGNPVVPEDYSQLIVRIQGEELKVWQTVIDYAAAQAVNRQGLAQIPPDYTETSLRINPEWSLPVIIRPAALVVFLAAGIGLFVKRKQLFRRLNLHAWRKR